MTKVPASFRSHTLQDIPGSGDGACASLDVPTDPMMPPGQVASYAESGKCANNI
jgi:hypothetical protein